MICVFSSLSICPFNTSLLFVKPQACNDFLTFSDFRERWRICARKLFELPSPGPLVFSEFESCSLESHKECSSISESECSISLSAIIFEFNGPETRASTCNAFSQKGKSTFHIKGLILRLGNLLKGNWEFRCTIVEALLLSGLQNCKPCKTVLQNTFDLICAYIFDSSMTFNNGKISELI